MTYVCPHCGAKISPKSETHAAKIKGTCPVCKQKVEFVASEGINEVKFTAASGKMETKPNARNIRKWKIIALLILLAIGSWVGWLLYDDYQRREMYKRWALEQQHQSTPYQPSFGSGEPNKFSNRETCTAHHCDCKIRRSWLEYKRYTTCPHCKHLVDWHND